MAGAAYAPLEQQKPGGSKRASTMFCDAAKRNTFTPAKQSALLIREIETNEIVDGGVDSWWNSTSVDHNYLRFLGCAGLLFGVAMVFLSFTWFQIADPVDSPDKWWQGMLVIAILFNINQMMYTFTMFDHLIWRVEFRDASGAPEVMPKKYLAYLYAVQFVVIVVLWIVCVQVVCPALGWNYPIPFQSFFVAGPSFICGMCTCIKLVQGRNKENTEPSDAVTNSFTLLFFGFVFLVAVLAYWAVAAYFIRCDESTQILIAALFPTLRMLFIEALGGLVAQIDPSSVILGQDAAVALHALTLAGILGSKVPTPIVVAIVGADFIVNMWDGLRVAGKAPLFWKQMLMPCFFGSAPDASSPDYVDAVRQKKLQALLYLAGSMSSMILLPLGYMCCFAITYNSPNATVMAGVKETRYSFEAFGHVPPDGISEVYSHIGLMIGGNLAAIVLNKVLLKDLPIWGVFIWAMKEFGPCVVVTQGLIFNMVFMELLVPFAIDLSLQFGWLNHGA